jgi:threonine dehydratase
MPALGVGKGNHVHGGLTLADVQSARGIIYRSLRPTPLLDHPLLRVETGLRLLVKHENHNPTGSFKVRGGLNLVGHLSAEERRGVITATTGNHGQSIALACSKEGVPCTIVVPTGNNPEKNAAMRAMGANVIEHGRDFDEARCHVERSYQSLGLRYVHSANEPLLIAVVPSFDRGWDAEPRSSASRPPVPTRSLDRGRPARASNTPRLRPSPKDWPHA